MVLSVKIKILSKANDRIVFALEDSNPAFANALRREIRNVPTMAIENVEIEENSSGLYDEVIAHRLGLIPLSFDKIYSKKKECRCGGKGCSRCEVILRLEKQGPCIVKAGDLQSDDKKVKPTNPAMPIVELLENQKLKLTAMAQLGSGDEHAKWQAAVVGYKYEPAVRIYSDKCNACGKCIEACPKNILQKKSGKLSITKSSECDLCLACINACDKNAIRVVGSESSFVFTLESVSGLKAMEILRRAIESLEKKSTNFINELKKT